MLIISIAIQKGGSGKTTTALNVAAALSNQSKKVLLIDIDPQANLTQSLGITEEPETTIYHLLKQTPSGENVPVQEAIIKKGNLSLLPASLSLADAEMELVSIYGREKLLTKVLSFLNNTYDFVIIDCPPAFGMLTVNALVASDYVLMPLQAEFLPFKGVESFMKQFRQIKTQLNPKLELLGLVLTRYDDNKTVHRQIKKQLDERYEGKVLGTTIRSNITLAKAQELGKDIFQVDRNCNGARDYLHLAAEVLERIRV